jgi:PilZ domain
MPASTPSLLNVLPFREQLNVIVGGRNTPAERRNRFRYSLDLSVRFGSAGPGARFFGQGIIVNMSSGGVLVASSHQPPVGELVELRIEWPSLLDGRVPLQLIAMGRILRRGPARFAAALERYEFRTKRSGQS